MGFGRHDVDELSAGMTPFRHAWPYRTRASSPHAAWTLSAPLRGRRTMKPALGIASLERLRLAFTHARTIDGAAAWLGVSRSTVIRWLRAEGAPTAGVERAPTGRPRR